MHKLAINTSSCAGLECSVPQPLIWYMKRITNNHGVHKLEATALSQVCHDYDRSFPHCINCFTRNPFFSRTKWDN